MKKMSRILQNPRTLCIAMLTATLLMQSQGYCDNAAQPKEFEEVSNGISNILFSSGLRKAALTLGMGAGLIQAFMAGSLRPLLIYGGLGLAVCYLPVIISKISAITV